MPTKMRYRDQLRHAIELAQTDCGPFGSSVLDLVLESLHNVPEDIVFEVPTLKEVMEKKRRRMEAK